MPKFENIDFKSLRQEKGKPGRKPTMLSKKEYAKVAGVGRKTTYLRPMSNSERKKLEYYKKVAKEKGVNPVVLDKYNVFEPELEAREFVALLFNNKGNLNKTVREYFTGYMTPEECHAKGMQVLEGTRVKQLIQEVLNARSIDVNGVVSRIVDIVDDDKTANKDKLKGLDMLGTYLNIFKKSPEGTVNYNLNISEDAARRLLERRERHNIIEGGDFAGVVQPGDTSDAEYVEELSDRLLDSDAEGVQSELASRDTGKEARSGGFW